MHGTQNMTLISIVKPMKIQFCFHQQRLNAEKDECQRMEGREQTTTTKYNNEKQQPHNISSAQCMNEFDQHLMETITIFMIDNLFWKW